MGLLPIHIQTQRRKNYFRLFNIFRYFFFNQLKIIRSTQKYAYIANFQALQKMGLLPIHFHTQNQNIIIDFRYYSLRFLNDLILFAQGDKNIEEWKILSPYRKCAYFPLISKPRAKKIILNFSISF